MTRRVQRGERGELPLRAREKIIIHLRDARTRVLLQLLIQIGEGRLQELAVIWIPSGFQLLKNPLAGQAQIFALAMTRCRFRR